MWIGPGSYFDARDLVLEDYVGWGPGAKVLGSTHTGLPVDVPIIQTDLEIRPVRIRAWADIGTNAVMLPGVTVGKGAIVGAGAVVDQGRARRSPSWRAFPRGSCTGEKATRRPTARDRRDSTPNVERTASMQISDSSILVTGGCGLIGSTTIDLLLRDYSPGADRDPRQPHAG